MVDRPGGQRGAVGAGRRGFRLFPLRPGFLRPRRRLPGPRRIQPGPAVVVPSRREAHLSRSRCPGRVPQHLRSPGVPHQCGALFGLWRFGAGQQTGRACGGRGWVGRVSGVSRAPSRRLAHRLRTVSVRRMHADEFAGDVLEPAGQLPGSPGEYCGLRRFNRGQGSRPDGACGLPRRVHRTGGEPEGPRLRLLPAPDCRPARRRTVGEEGVEGVLRDRCTLRRRFPPAVPGSRHFALRLRPIAVPVGGRCRAQRRGSRRCSQVLVFLPDPRRCSHRAPVVRGGGDRPARGLRYGRSDGVLVPPPLSGDHDRGRPAPPLSIVSHRHRPHGAPLPEERWRGLGGGGPGRFRPDRRGDFGSQGEAPVPQVRCRRRARHR